MPKVKTETLRFENGPFVCVYKVDGSGTFSVGLPLFMQEVLNQEEVRSDTLEDCQKGFWEAHKRYNEAQTTTERVIVYSVRASAHIWNDERVVYSEKDVAFARGMALEVAAQVLDERAIKTPDGSVKYRYDNVKDCELNRRAVTYGARFEKFPHQRHEHRLPYTPEREQFFIKISRGLEAVILQLDLLNEPGKALAFADSGKLALPENV